jgi:hypothetical protein
MEVQQISAQESSVDLIFPSSVSETHGPLKLSLDVVILGLQQPWLAHFSMPRAFLFFRPWLVRRSGD